MTKGNGDGPWAGVDVGGRRKGFHLAVIKEDRVTELEHYPDAQTLAAHLIELKPQAIGIDSPSEWAPEGQKSRPAEREFAARKICGIRYTPSLTTAQAHPGTYYEWIFNGMELWDALRQDPHLKDRLFEVFPTASWTIWHGPRGNRKREEWSQEALESLPLQLPEVKWTQDLRDATAAALSVALEPLRPDREGVLEHIRLPSRGQALAPAGHPNSRPPVFCSRSGGTQWQRRNEAFQPSSIHLQSRMRCG